MRRETAVDAKEALQLYEDFIARNGNSENVRKMYRRRVEVFLGARPDALEADGKALRDICDEYVSALPANSATEVAAAAVRYFWTMVTGRPYFERLALSYFERDDLIEREASEFEAWMRSELSLDESTIANRLRTVRQMLYSTFEPGTFDRRSVSAVTVRRHIAERAGKVAPTTVGRMVADIRSYANFLVAHGVGPARQIALLPLKAPSRARNVGPIMSDGDFRRIVAETEGGGERGLRDRAILLLMGNLGLRASDVAALSVDDVDWSRGLLHVRESKSVSDRTVPIDEETGSALEAYVVGARRPRPGTRALFLPAGRETDGTAVTSAQVIRAVKLLAEKAGVSGYHGSHSIRRAVATGMVAGGASVKVVADVLGHESVRTTMRYLRVDMASLSQACSPWPEAMVR